MSMSGVLIPFDKKSRFTASFGVVFTNNISTISIDELLKQADNALYKAKKKWKKQCCYFDFKSNLVFFYCFSS